MAENNQSIAEKKEFDALMETGSVIASKANAESFLQTCWNESISVSFEKCINGVLFKKN